MNDSEFPRHLLHPRNWPTWFGMGCWWLVSQLPYRLLYRMGTLLGDLMYLVGSRRKEIARQNIRLCFPELNAGQRERLLRENFHSYGMGFFEIAIGWWWSERRFARLVRVEGLENIENLDGRGALLMALHYTTLEIGAQALNRLTAIDGMYRPHKNPVYDYLQRRGRIARNATTRVYPRKDVRGVMKALRSGRVLWYAPDQDYGPKQSVFAPFFGVDAASVTATARFAEMGKAAVLPFTHVRLPGGQGYRVTVHPPLENFPSGDDVADATRINGIVEEFIRRQPDQYLWAHRRFKTRPSGEEPVYTKLGKKRRHGRIA